MALENNRTSIPGKFTSKKKKIKLMQATSRCTSNSARPSPPLKALIGISGIRFLFQIHRYVRDVFVPTSEPSGTIYCEVAREATR